MLRKHSSRSAFLKQIASKNLITLLSKYYVDVVTNKCLSRNYFFVEYWQTLSSAVTIGYVGIPRVAISDFSAIFIRDLINLDWLRFKIEWKRGTCFSSQISSTWIDTSETLYKWSAQHCFCSNNASFKIRLKKVKSRKTWNVLSSTLTWCQTNTLNVSNFMTIISPRFYL